MTDGLAMIDAALLLLAAAVADSRCRLQRSLGANTRRRWPSASCTVKV